MGACSPSFGVYCLQGSRLAEIRGQSDRPCPAYGHLVSALGPLFNIALSSIRLVKNSSFQIENNRCSHGEKQVIVMIRLWYPEGSDYVR